MCGGNRINWKCPVCRKFRRVLIGLLLVAAALLAYATPHWKFIWWTTLTDFIAASLIVTDMLIENWDRWFGQDR